MTFHCGLIEKADDRLFMSPQSVKTFISDILFKAFLVNNSSLLANVGVGIHSLFGIVEIFPTA